MTAVEKILARHAGVAQVAPGDVVATEVDTVVLLDMNFLAGNALNPPIVKTDRPERIVVVFDHLAIPKDEASADALRRGREFVEQWGIERFHDIGRDQGIVHQLVGEHGYVRPGELLVCTDSHTCSGGAYNAGARGIGPLDVVHAACTGRTWWQCGPTVRYRLEGTPGPAVAPKDVFLHIAAVYGDHAMQNLELTGSTVDAWTVDERRAFATMCAELGAEFPIFPCDDVLRRHFEGLGITDVEPVVADPGATYLDTRAIDVPAIEPMVAKPHTVINNSVPIASLEEPVRVHQCFIGSCANGTLDDLRIAAETVRGGTVSPTTRFVITPGSQRVYREAVAAGYVSTLLEAGAVITNSGCGACAGQGMGILAPGETAITSSTRNFQGRMGSPTSNVFIGSSASVAASALTGVITDPREVAA
ncbi:MAG TPA: aconitase/3-isopropylmalate dehydratase large subunit family protein [Acidimicrobiales bacterium]|nr:aconitase/3-isopropylmalate dehydratase large subunit family protein [Acidimicrobiales bacterium]